MLLWHLLSFLFTYYIIRISSYYQEDLCENLKITLGKREIKALVLSHYLGLKIFFRFIFDFY